MLHFICPCCDGDFESGHHSECTFATDCPEEYEEQGTLWDLQAGADKRIRALKQEITELRETLRVLVKKEEER